MERILVTEQERDEIQRFALEMESRKELMAFMIQSDMPISGTQFKTYEKEYKKAYLDFINARTEIEKKYVIPLLKDDESVNWNLDYATCEITFK